VTVRVCTTVCWTFASGSSAGRDVVVVDTHETTSESWGLNALTTRLRFSDLSEKLRSQVAASA
jgi:hypothetical protein